MVFSIGVYSGSKAEIKRAIKTLWSVIRIGDKVSDAELISGVLSSVVCLKLNFDGSVNSGGLNQKHKKNQRVEPLENQKNFFCLNWFNSTSTRPS